MPLVASASEPALPSRRNLDGRRPKGGESGNSWRPLPASCEKTRINTWTLHSGSGRWAPGPSQKNSNVKDSPTNARAATPASPAKKAEAKKAVRQQTQIVLIPAPETRTSKMTDSFAMCRRDRSGPGWNSRTSTPAAAPRLTKANLMAASASAAELTRSGTAASNEPAGSVGDSDEAEDGPAAPCMAWEAEMSGVLDQHPTKPAPKDKVPKKSPVAQVQTKPSSAADRPMGRRMSQDKKFSLSESSCSWISSRRASLENDSQRAIAIEPGMTLQDWFEAKNAGLDQTSSCDEGDTFETYPVMNRAEQQREAIRKEMIKSAGGALEAFRMIDLSGSKSTSPSEFSEGMKQLGINWQEITGMTRLHDLFKLFDTDKNGSVNMEDIFPEEQYHGLETQRVSTPEFWNHWCKRTAETHRSGRGPKWQPDGPDEELQMMCSAADKRQSVEDEKRRMAAMIRRLKNQGKSDARCRECVALHLPRGTGPKDREHVQAFTDAEVRACKRSYNDPILSHVRNIQKVVFQDMREQRRDLQTSKSHLWKVTMEPIMRKRAEEAQKQMLDGLQLFGPPSEGKTKFAEDSAAQG